MNGDYFRGIDTIIKFAYFSLIFLFPLALWKIIDISIWTLKHIQINIH